LSLKKRTGLLLSDDSYRAVVLQAVCPRAVLFGLWFLVAMPVKTQTDLVMTFWFLIFLQVTAGLILAELKFLNVLSIVIGGCFSLVLCNPAYLSFCVDCGPVAIIGERWWEF